MRVSTIHTVYMYMYSIHACKSMHVRLHTHTHRVQASDRGSNTRHAHFFLPHSLHPPAREISTKRQNIVIFNRKTGNAVHTVHKQHTNTSSIVPCTCVPSILPPELYVIIMYNHMERQSGQKSIATINR